MVIPKQPLFSRVITICRIATTIFLRVLTIFEVPPLFLWLLQKQPLFFGVLTFATPPVFQCFKITIKIEVVWLQNNHTKRGGLAPQ